MNFNKVGYFCVVARALNFTKAAEELYMSQPVLSRHIADLESDLGTPLFTRTNRNLILTKAGEALYAECGAFFAREHELYKIVHEAAAQDITSLRVVFMGTRAAYRLPEIQHHFEEKLPGVDLEFERSNWDRVLRGVESGEADVGIKVCTFEQYPEDIGRYVIKEDHLSVILPQSHALAGRPNLTIDMLREEPIVMLDRSDSVIPHDITLRLFSDAGIRPRVAGHYPNVETALLMVQAGAGLMVLSPFAPMGGLMGLTSVPIKNAPPLTLDVIWKKKGYNIAIDSFLRAVQELEW